MLILCGNYAAAEHVTEASPESARMIAGESHAQMSAL